MTNKYELYDVLLRPLVSEKSNILLGDNKYVFFVDKRSNKGLVKKSVEFIFNVKVDSVNMLNVRSNSVRFKGVSGRQASKKKAFVTLVSGYKIDLVEGV